MEVVFAYGETLREDPNLCENMEWNESLPHCVPAFAVSEKSTPGTFSKLLLDLDSERNNKFVFFTTRTRIFQELFMSIPLWC
jgi:hypothetical protein